MDESGKINVPIIRVAFNSASERQYARIPFPHLHAWPQHGRRRALWRATGMTRRRFRQADHRRSPIPFTQFVPGPCPSQGHGATGGARDREGGRRRQGIQHHRGGRRHRHGTRRHAVFAAQSRELIADSGGIHGQRPLRRRAGVHFQLRQDHTGHADGGDAPEHPGGVRLRRADGGRQGQLGRQDHAGLDLVDAMVAAADDKVTDAECEAIERSACPTCGSCSGMFTANSMNCLAEALGWRCPATVRWWRRMPNGSSCSCAPGA